MLQKNVCMAVKKVISNVKGPKKLNEGFCFGGNKTKRNSQRLQKCCICSYQLTPTTIHKKYCTKNITQKIYFIIIFYKIIVFCIIKYYRKKTFSLFTTKFCERFRFIIFEVVVFSHLLDLTHAHCCLSLSVSC